MNSIEAIETVSYNRKILSINIDGKPLDQLLCDLTNDLFYRDLWSAWLLNDDDNDSKYIWTLLDERRSCNLPILLCPDDMDFWCTVIVAKVSYTKDTVVWDNIGIVTGTIDIEKWRESGIMNISSWSDLDYEKYGDLLPIPDKNIEYWQQLWSKDWCEEEKKRIWNYFDPYFNDDKNIKWLNCPVFTFPIDSYNNCISTFRNFETI